MTGKLWTCLLVIVALLIGVAAVGQEYILQDYMPQTIGSKWTLKQTTGDEAVSTLEVLEPEDINGVQVMPLVWKDADGNITRGSLESVTLDSFTIFGSMFRPRGRGNQPAPTEPFRMMYDPPAVFPGKLTVGQTAEAAVKIARGDQQFESTLKLELAAVESVTVPKGTFEDCLKLVYTTSFGERQMTRTVWHAKGVGLVKTESPGRDGTTRVQELTEYELGQ